jgi:hypothetical protein
MDPVGGQIYGGLRKHRPIFITNLCICSCPEIVIQNPPIAKFFNSEFMWDAPRECSISRLVDPSTEPNTELQRK